MTFEIFRCDTQFCWRLLDGGALVAEGARPRRQRAQIEEEILHLMDMLPAAHVVDKTVISAAPKSSRTNDKLKQPKRAA